MMPLDSGENRKCGRIRDSYTSARDELLRQLDRVGELKEVKKEGRRLKDISDALTEPFKCSMLHSLLPDQWGSKMIGEIIFIR